jgi:fatty acid desaturase
MDLPRTLWRKMAIDSLGGLLCLVALIGALSGYEIESTWALALVFLVANVFLLLVQPMYRVFDPPHR